MTCVKVSLVQRGCESCNTASHQSEQDDLKNVIACRLRTTFPTLDCFVFNMVAFSDKNSESDLLCEQFLLLVPFTYHFSGPGRAVGMVCLCVRVRTITFELHEDQGHRSKFTVTELSNR